MGLIKVPDKSGFYWFFGKVKGYTGEWYQQESTIVKIDTDFEDEPRVYFIGTDSGATISEVKGHFYGPLLPPNITV